MAIRLHIIDPTEVMVSKRDARFIAPALSYETSYWRTGLNRKEEVFYTKDVFCRKQKGYWFFWSGLLDRVLQHCEKEGLEVEVEKESDLGLLPTVDPIVHGLTFKPHQLKLLNDIRERQRGIIKAPTRTGKTIIMIGVASSFPRNFKTLILAHTSTIITQTVKRFREYNFSDVQQMGAGKGAKEGLHGSIVISTIQSFKNLDHQDYADYFDIVIVDEVHRVSKLNGIYAQVLSRLLATVRLGFTATPRTDSEAQFAAEGLIGPLIGELPMAEAIKKEIIAKPKILIRKTEYSRLIRQIRKYQDVYERGIVEYYPRNIQIANDVIDFLNQQFTVLVLVNRIQHGVNILNAICEVADAPREYINEWIRFLRGSSDEELKEEARMMLQTGEIRCVICTPIWKEGTDIPALNAVINAGGGKGEIATLQAVGRALTPAKDKKEGIIVDYFDPSSRYLVDHFGHRFSLYCDEGWIEGTG